MTNDDELVVVSFVKMLPFPPQVWSARVWWVCHLERQVLVKRKKEQDQVSTMQKTGWTNHSAFQSRHSSSLVWFGPVWSDILFDGISDGIYADICILGKCEISHMGTHVKAVQYSARTERGIAMLLNTAIASFSAVVSSWHQGTTRYHDTIAKRVSGRTWRQWRAHCCTE